MRFFFLMLKKKRELECGQSNMNCYVALEDSLLFPVLQEKSVNFNTGSVEMGLQ